MSPIIQFQKKGVVTPEVVTRITSIWAIGYCGMYFSGSFIAGTMTDYLTYSGTQADFHSSFLIQFQLYFTSINTLASHMNRVTS